MRLQETVDKSTIQVKPTLSQNNYDIVSLYIYTMWSLIEKHKNMSK